MHGPLSLPHPRSAAQPVCVSVHSGTRKLDRSLFYRAQVEATAFDFVFSIIIFFIALTDFLHRAIFGVLQLNHTGHPFLGALISEGMRWTGTGEIRKAQDMCNLI